MEKEKSIISTLYGMLKEVSLHNLIFSKQNFRLDQCPTVDHQLQPTIITEISLSHNQQPHLLLK